MFLMVTPRSCSSSLVSVNRASPACLAKMMLILRMSESINDNFPWSTCVMTLMDWMLSVFVHDLADLIHGEIWHVGWKTLRPPNTSGHSSCVNVSASACCLKAQIGAWESKTQLRYHVKGLYSLFIESNRKHWYTLRDRVMT